MGFYLLDHAVNNGTVWQQWGYPRRGANLSGTCIMHTSESALDMLGPDATAEDCAAFIGRRTGSYGSYHDLVDSDSIIELVPFEYEAWQDSETNPWAVGISAACRTTDWLTMGDAKREGFYRNLAWCAADFVTYMKAAYNITVPLIRISGAEARARKPGFCAHGDSGISRTDPGANFDWARFFEYTKQELAGGHVMALTPEEHNWLSYLVSPDFKKHIWQGTQPAEIEARAAFIQELFNTDLPWMGFNGVQPTTGRTTTTLKVATGWADTHVGTLANLINNVGNVTLTADDLAVIVASLKDALAPAIAVELAKRLAE